MSAGKMTTWLLIGLLLTGCAMGGAGKLNRVKLGMSEADSPPGGLLLVGRRMM